MKILAITNAVPDPRSTLRLDGLDINSGGVGVKWAINPYDEYAVEQAVQLKEKHDDVDEIVVMAVGGDEAVTALRHAMAIGADRSVHIVCDAWHDDLYIARLLAAAITASETSYDLILCGKSNLSRDSEVMGPAVAELLNLPHVGGVIALELNNASAKATHKVVGANEVVEVQLPAVLMCDKTLVEPRFTPLLKVMQARKKPLETMQAEELIPDAQTITLISLAAPSEKGACTMIEGTPKEMASELIRVLRVEAKVL